MVSEEELRATGLPERILATYRLAGASALPLPERKQVAKKLGVAESTVKRHLSRVRQHLEGAVLVQPTKLHQGTPLEMLNPDKYAEAVSRLSEPYRAVESVAKRMGMSPPVAYRIAHDLEAELNPLKREISEIRLDDLTKRFGTLARDAIDAITPEKLAKANAQQLGVISGIAVDKWQLLRGQPTQRTEIGDRRQMNELMAMLFKEAKRRGIEIDVTPEGGAIPQKSPYQNAKRQRDVKKIQSGDPAETLVPA